MSMRFQEPGWIQLGSSKDPSGRRQLWVRFQEDSIELCSGREGDDAYVKLSTAGEQGYALRNVFEYAACLEPGWDDVLEMLDKADKKAVK